MNTWSSKVLLPPRTSVIYERLLKTEATELSSADLQAQRSLEYIRHIKDRLIRKCHKLANWRPPPPGTQATSIAIAAPSDFRLKEMDRWWSSEQIARSYSSDLDGLNSLTRGRPLH